MTTETEHIACPSCHQLINGTYCAHCGEKRLSEHDFSLRHFIEEGIEGFTHFDNKFFRSVKLLITQPGQLAAYYFKGKRVAFMKPLQLFIVCNLLFFFLLGHSNLFSIPFYSYKIFKPYTSFGTEKNIAQKATTPEQLKSLSEVFNERMAIQSKAFIIFFIPVFAVGFALLYLHKKKYFTEHLVFATHFFSFILLYYIGFRFVVELPFVLIAKTNFSSTFDFVATMLSLVVIASYCTVAAKKFYGVSTVRAIVSSFLIVCIFVLAIYAFRLLLFYKIIYSIH